MPAKFVIGAFSVHNIANTLRTPVSSNNFAVPEDSRSICICLTEVLVPSSYAVA